MAAIKYWLWLSGLSGVSARAKAELIKHYSDAERAFFAPEGEYISIPGISREEAARLEKRDVSGVIKILEECDSQGIDIITMQDARYPVGLKNIYAPPVVLYVKGSLPELGSVPSIAVIGTRKASPYGIKMGRSIAYDIAKCGGAVISMLTEGIDREAARGCLMAGGCCIAILGTPHGNMGTLYRDITAKGALISEYPPGMPPQKHFFRERNRIASGLSRGVVVVEAPEKSGTLLFAEEASEQGREIFAVPGNADAPNSVGTIELIRQGARPVTCGWDVMSEFEYLFPGAIKKYESTIPGAAAAEKDYPASEAGQDTTIKDIDRKKPEGYIDLRAQLEALSEDQLKIITAIDNKETHIDDIIQSTGMNTAKVLAQLTILEVKGFVRRSAGRRFSLNIKSK